MPDSFDFPEHVLAFESFLDTFLLNFGLKKELSISNQEIEAKEFHIRMDGRLITLIIHRTQRSFGSEDGEYRARMIEQLSDDFRPIVTGRDKFLNRYASLAALHTSDKTPNVIAQAIIPSRQSATPLQFSETTAGVLVASIIWGAPSLVAPIIQAHKPRDNNLNSISSWSDLDFEQIHYDAGHLGVGVLSKRQWSMTLGNGVALSMTGVHDNPFFGGGLLNILNFPDSIFGGREKRPDAARCNMACWLASDIPLFGAWCDDDNSLVFVQFIPNQIKTLSGIGPLLIDWARRRSVEITHLERSSDQSDFDDGSIS